MAESKSQRPKQAGPPRAQTKRSAESNAAPKPDDAEPLDEMILAEQQPVSDTQSDPDKTQTLPSTEAKQKKTVRLGDYQLIKKLGQGSMGEVFLDRQVSLDRTVTVKMLSKKLAKQESFVKRFLREARAMAKLDHPNAVRVFAVDSSQRLHFSAIEYVDGQSMQHWLDRLGKISIGDAVHVVLRCADALNSAHRMKLIHRDIKPDNILPTSHDVVKVADFGLAKVLDEDTSLTETRTGMGTPRNRPETPSMSINTVTSMHWVSCCTIL